MELDGMEKQKEKIRILGVKLIMKLEKRKEKNIMIKVK